MFNFLGKLFRKDRGFVYVVTAHDGTEQKECVVLPHDYNIARPVYLKAIAAYGGANVALSSRRIGSVPLNLASAPEQQ